MKTIIFIGILMAGSGLGAQSGRIFGTVSNSKNPADSNFTLSFLKYGRAVDTCMSSGKGRFSKILNPGMYDVVLLHKGRSSKTIRGVLISGGENPVSFTLAMDTAEVYRQILYLPDTTEKRVLLTKAIAASAVGAKSAVHKKSSTALRSPGLRGDAELISVDGVRIPTSAETESLSADAGVATGNSGIKAGQLTAGHWHDLGHWDAWLTTNDRPEIRQYQMQWGLFPDKLLRLRFKDKHGKPLAYSTVQLEAPDGHATLKAHTDQDGYAYFWPELSGKGQVPYNCAVVNGRRFEHIEPYINSVRSIEVPEKAEPTSGLDIAFVVDATGSMGDEIRYLQAEMDDVISRVRKRASCLDIRTGAVFYRDHGDAYLCRVSKLNREQRVCSSFIRDQSAGGGGDFPEAVDAAMESALTELGWSSDKRVKIMFLILDAPPHGDTASINRIKRCTLLAAEQGIRIIPVTASGIDKATEFLMKDLAIISNGEYVYITNDSRIGGHHLTPTGGESKVLHLNKLMLNLILRYSKSAACPDMEIPQWQDSIQIQEQKLDSLIRQTQVPREIITGKGWHMQYFPNPASNRLHIRLSRPAEKILIQDLSGKIVWQMEHAEPENELLLEQFNSGIYLIHAYWQNEVLSGKLCIIH